MRTASLSWVNRPRNGADNQHLTRRFSMGTATHLPLCIQCYVMTFALIEITYCTAIYCKCTKLFGNHTLTFWRRNYFFKF